MVQGRAAGEGGEQVKLGVLPTNDIECLAKALNAELGRVNLCSPSAAFPAMVHTFYPIKPMM